MYLCLFLHTQLTFFVSRTILIQLCPNIQFVYCFQSDSESNQLSLTLPSDFKVSGKTDSHERKLQKMESFAFFNSHEESNLLKMRSHPSLGSSEPNLRTLSVCSKLETLDIYEKNCLVKISKGAHWGLIVNDM